MKIFGERLRLSIAAHGISEAEFSRKTGISPQNISHYIAGQRKPGIDVLALMIRALPNENVRWLIGAALQQATATQPAQTDAARDAARYRWLRDNFDDVYASDNDGNLLVSIKALGLIGESADKLDAAIDAALVAAQPTSGGDHV